MYNARMKKSLLILLLCAGVMAACSQAAPLISSPSPFPTRAGTLQPYSGPTLTSTPSPTSADTPTPLPTATPTPRTHTVRANQDLWGIALFYGVTLQDLLTANPTVNPNAMRVGTELLIPAPIYTPTIDPNNPPLPTPVSLVLEAPNCVRGAGGGIWCFSSAASQQTVDIEGLSAVFHLYDKGSGEILSRSAYPPLNLLTPNSFLPLAVYFSPPAPEDFEVSIELVTALPVPPESDRYLTLAAEGQQVTISPDGLSARVSGRLSLTAEQGAAAWVTVAAVAYDDQDRITGIRVWESSSGLAGGESLDYEFTLYTTGAPIERVDVLFEAVP